MIWKIVYIALTVICIFTVWMYAGKKLIISLQTQKENVPDGNGGFFIENVTRTYHENYTAIGGAIGFAIIAGAALVGLAILIVKEKQNRVH